MKTFRAADVKIWGVIFIFLLILSKISLSSLRSKWLTEECIMATTRHFEATDCLIKYSGVCVCVCLLRVCLASSFGGLVQLQVQFDPNFPRGDLVQQEAPIRRTFALHLLLYGRHGNFGATEEIWKKRQTSVI